MAVLKSFELNGNKLSFANWISNLSPKTTPFTSMIGKEKIDQTQYSWQTDSLAPASARTYEEGSKALSQPRAVTKVLTNFTSIIRKGVKVTDTNEATHAYGRTDELAYQLGKAGQEILRDVEYMNLSTQTAIPGSTVDASRHAGFKELCAPMYVPDPDTMAMTHQGVAIVDPEQPWFALKDIFKVTTDLFIAGSKADKIMFHPKHINIFSDQIGYNDEEPLVYRMFDNLNDTYNMKVSKIRDSLGRMYTLIPNRFMPENEVYFFHESDWTQMVLQEPVKKNLARKGSSQSLMVETQVGLRHRHPHASGVLHLISVNYVAALTTTTNVLSTLPGDEGQFTFALNHDDGTAADSVDFKIHVSDLDILDLDTYADQTDATGLCDVPFRARKYGRAVVYGYRNDVDHRLLTNPVTIEVLPPVLTLEIDQDTIDLGHKLDATTAVTHPGTGTSGPATCQVTWHSDSPNTLFFLPDDTFINPGTVVPTDINGISHVKFSHLGLGDFYVWAELDGVETNHKKMTSKPAGVQFDWGTSKDIFTVDLDKDVEIEVSVNDKNGDPMDNGVEVTWMVENGTYGKFQRSQTVVQDGVTKNYFTAEGAGDTYAILSCLGDVYKHQITCDTILAETELDPSNTVGIGNTVTLSTTLIDSHGAPIPNMLVHWEALPTSYGELGTVQATTDAQGQAQTTFKGNNRGVGEITTTALGRDLTTTKFFVGTGAKVILDINPNPTTTGQETRFNVNVEGQDGVPLADEAITFSSNPDIGDLSALGGDTDGTGNWNNTITFTVDMDTTIVAHVGGFDSTDAEFLTFEDRIFTYSSPDAGQKLTVGIGKTYNFTTNVVDADNDPVGNVQVEYHLTNASKGTIQVLNNGMTNASGSNTIKITPLQKGQFGLVAKVKGRANSHTFQMEIGDPTVSFNFDKPLINFGETVTVLGTVLDADGATLQDVDVNFYVDPFGDGKETLSTSNMKTNNSGSYTTTWKPNTDTVYSVYAFLKNYPSVNSGIEKLTVKGKDLNFYSTGHETLVTHGLNQLMPVTIRVRDTAMAVPGVEMEYEVANSSVARIHPTSSMVTDGGGNVVIYLEPLSAGTTWVTARVKGHSRFHDFQMRVGNPKLELRMNPRSQTAGKDVGIGCSLKDAHDHYVAGVDIAWEHPSIMVAHNAGIPVLTTDNIGQVAHTFKAGAWGNHTLTAYVKDFPNVRSNSMTLTSVM